MEVDTKAFIESGTLIQVDESGQVGFAVAASNEIGVVVFIPFITQSSVDSFIKRHS